MLSVAGPPSDGLLSLRPTPVENPNRRGPVAETSPSSGIRDAPPLADRGTFLVPRAEARGAHGVSEGAAGVKGAGSKRCRAGQAGDRYRSRTSEGAGPGIKRVPAGPRRGPLSIPHLGRDQAPGTVVDPATRDATHAPETRLTRPRRDSRARDELQRLGAPRSRVLRLRVVGSGDGGEHDLVHPVGRREGADLRGDGLPGADEPP